MTEILTNKYKSSLIKICASDAKYDSGNETSTVRIGLNSQLEGLRNVTAIQIISVSINHTFYNVKDCKFLYTIGGVDKTLNFTDGNYTIDTFMAEFAVLWLAAEGVNIVYTPTTGGTPSLNPNTLKLALNLNTASAVSFTSSLDNKLAAILGYGISGKTYVTNGTGALTSPHMVNLLSVDQVMIHSPELSSKSIVPNIDTHADFIISVNLNVPFGSNCFHEVTSGSSSLLKYSTPQTFTTLSLSIRDKYHKLLDTNGSDWTIIFKAYYFPY